jgi:hypothetical protein
VRWELLDVSSADGHTLSVGFACSIRAVPDRIERRMLEEVLLGNRSAVTADDVAAHFQPALRSAAAKIARQHPASNWMADESLKQQLCEVLKSSANATAFACGLEILGPYPLDLQSPTFERQRLLQLQQELTEKQAAGQIEHFQRAAGLLKQFEALRSATPELPPGRVLQQVGAADRGQVLQTLLMASAGKRPRRLWAVAGPYLVEIDPRSNGEGRLSPHPNLVSLPPALGPLRSVTAAEIDGRQALLIGARSGFILYFPDEPSQPRLFHDSAVQTQHGFNRIDYWPQRRQFCGSHADAGIVCWDADSPDAPTQASRTLELLPAGWDLAVAAPSVAINTFASYAGSIQGGGSSGPRNLVVLDQSSLLFSIGAGLFVWDGKSAAPLQRESNAEIVAILPERDRLLCVSDDGAIDVMERASRQWASRDHRTGRVRAAGALPWLATTRLLLSGDEGPIQCLGLDDPLITQYASAYRGVRMVAGSADVVAACSPDRQRVILWNSWDGRQPAAELFVTPLTRHRLTDLSFG